MRAIGHPPPMVRPRLYLGKGLSLGPGKVDLLRKVGECGSISAAARALGIPYKRAWLLLDTLKGLPAPVVETVKGGRRGGGARLTPLGVALVAAYDELEHRLNDAARPEIEALQRLVQGMGPP